MRRPLLARILNPGVPWPIAIACNAAGAVALVLLAIDSDGNLPATLAILIPGAVLLYGTALTYWLRRRMASRDEQT